MWMAIAAISGVMQAGMAIQAGRAQEIQSKQQARQMKIDRELGEVRALQQRNNRLEQYAQARASNDAVFAYMGKDSSTSVAAFQKAQQRTVAKDTSRIEFQSGMESRKQTVEARLEIMRGQNAMRAARINALSRLTSTAYNVYRMR